MSKKKTMATSASHTCEEQGMSGGQQNKDEEVVNMVARMNELKEKQDRTLQLDHQVGQLDLWTGQSSSQQFVLDTPGHVWMKFECIVGNICENLGEYLP